MSAEPLFRAVAAALLLLVIAIALPHRLRAHRAGGTPPRREEGALFVPLRLAGLVAFGTVIAWIANPAWVAFAAVPLPAWSRWAGAALVVLAAALIAWVFHHLGLNLTDTVVVRERATLVTTGPYRFVRHPLYTAMIPALLGLTLLSGNLLAAAAGAIAGALIGRRTRIEEALLVERHGAAYLDYAAGTPRYGPLPRRAPALRAPDREAAR
jgi:protein-S-isoprenylcysteine O-methyltransferase Ste14